MSTTEFVLINLQVCIVQTATVLQLEFTTDFFSEYVPTNYIPGSTTKVSRVVSGK